MEQKLFFDTLDKSLCCGCGVCAIKCPSDAIVMTPDTKGFIYPQIDNALCVGCGLCRSVCQYGQKAAVSSYKKEYFAARISDTGELDSVSSGGIAFALAKQVLNGGGVCAGAVYNEDFVVEHSLIASLSEAGRLKTSKYAQSDMAGCYSPIEENLKSGKTVLFFGTPCQVAAVKKYIGPDHPDLITCDLICGGVPSPLVLKTFLKELSEKYNSPVKAITMKDKSEGWLTPSLKVTFANKAEYCKKLYDTSFGALFGKHITVRESCRKCKYASLDRTGDITVGDYWSLKKYYPDKFDNKGMSTVIVNTNKGKALWESIKNSVDCFRVTEEESLQGRLTGDFSEVSGQEEALFWRKFAANKPIDGIYEKFFTVKPQKISFLKRVKRKIKSYL